MKRKPVKTSDGIMVFCAHTRLADPRRIKPHPENTRRHPAEQLELLAEIIESSGWRETITVSKRSGFITRGHARAEAARQKGWKQVPIDIQEYAGPEDEMADLLADTRIKEFSTLNDEKLRALIIRLKENAGDLRMTALAPTVIETILRDYQRSLEVAMLHPETGSGSDTIRQVILVFDNKRHAAFGNAILALEKKRQFGSLSEMMLTLLREHADRNPAQAAT